MALRRTGIWALILAVAVLFFDISNADIALQDYLYDFQSGQWLLDRHDNVLRLFFYTGPKAVLMVFAVCLLVYLWWSRQRDIGRAYRAGWRVLLLSLLVVPAVITGLKNITNVACPADLQRYGGDVPYVRLMASYPESARPDSPQRCFPAGHASGGFALLALFYLPRTPRYRLGLLSVGAAAGGLMGGYKMMIGHHFLSHTVASAMLAWLLIQLIVAVLPAAWRLPVVAPSGVAATLPAPAALLDT